MHVLAFLEGPELVLIVLIVEVVAFALDLWALIDAAGKPDWAWQQAGSNKLLYILLIAIGFFLCGIVALVTAIVYLTSTRQRLQRVMTSGQGQGGYAPGYGQARPGAWQPGGQQQGWPAPQPLQGPAAGQPAPGWWQASDGNWYPPQAPPSSAPGPDWWQASDGNWYPPESRPGGQG